MTTKNTISPLLESIVKDNETFKFPIETIRKELLNMFIEPMEYDYFMMQAYKKIKREYGGVIGHIFLSTLEMVMKSSETDPYTLATEQYHNKIEEFISTLEKLYITRIEKTSPDGEMISAMV